jgi:hypothetical protein
MSDFGLSNENNAPKQEVDLTLLAAAIKPRQARQINVGESDRGAAANGFTSREPVLNPPELYIRPVKKQVRHEQRTTLSFKPRASVHLRFNEYALKYKLSNPDALEKLLDDAALLERLQAEQTRTSR